MSSPEHIRKRLNSLKILTGQLRDCTANAPLDLTQIKQILNNTKQLHDSNVSKQNSDKNNHMFQLTANDVSYRPLFPQTKLPSVSKLHSQDENENIKLVENTDSLREQIETILKEKQRLEEECKKTSIPFFRLAQNLEGFVGRLDFRASSYDKVDYSEYEAELKLDRLILLRKEKGALQQFQLSTLKEVDYGGDCTIQLKFEEFISQQKTNLTNVFLKLYSPEHLHKWDLSLFTNFNIINSLNEPRLFENYFRKLKLDVQNSKQQQKISELRESKQLDHSKQKDLLKLLIKKREEYLQIKNLISEKLQGKIKASQLSNLSNSEYLDIPKQEINKIQQSKVKIQIQELNKVPARTKIDPSKNNHIYSSPIEQIKQLEPHQEESEQKAQKKDIQIKPILHYTDSVSMDSNNDIFNRKSFFTSQVTNQTQKPFINQISIIQPQTDQGMFPLTPPPFVYNSETRNTNLPRRQSKFSIVNQLNGIDNNRNGSFDSSSRNTSLSKFRDLSISKINNARANLQNGYFATKYSKDGFSSHEKKIFLSLDSKKLCWSERDKHSEYKSIPLEVITKVQYGVLGEGIVKHVKNPDARYFCVIEYFTNDYKKKTIELGSGNMQDIKSIASELNIVIKRAKHDSID